MDYTHKKSAGFDPIAALTRLAAFDKNNDFVKLESNLDEVIAYITNNFIKPPKTPGEIAKRCDYLRKLRIELEEAEVKYREIIKVGQNCAKLNDEHRAAAMEAVEQTKKVIDWLCAELI